MNETKKYSHVCCRVQNPCVRQWIEWASPHFLISHQGLAQDKTELPVLTEFKDIRWSHHMPGQLLNKRRQTFLFSSQLNQEESQNLCKYITLKLSRTAEKKNGSMLLLWRLHSPHGITWCVQHTKSGSLNWKKAPLAVETQFSNFLVGRWHSNLDNLLLLIIHEPFTDTIAYTSARKTPCDLKSIILCYLKFTDKLTDESKFCAITEQSTSKTV